MAKTTLDNLFTYRKDNYHGLPCSFSLLTDSCAAIPMTAAIMKALCEYNFRKRFI